MCVFIVDHSLNFLQRSVAAFNTDVELLQSYSEVDGQRRMENSTMHQWQHIDHDQSQMLKFMRTSAKSLWSPRFCSTMLSCESLSSWSLFSLLFLILSHTYDLPISQICVSPLSSTAKDEQRISSSQMCVSIADHSLDSLQRSVADLNIVMLIFTTHYHFAKICNLLQLGNCIVSI